MSSVIARVKFLVLLLPAVAAVVFEMLKGVSTPFNRVIEAPPPEWYAPDLWPKLMNSSSDYKVRVNAPKSAGLYPNFSARKAEALQAGDSLSFCEAIDSAAYKHATVIDVKGIKANPPSAATVSPMTWIKMSRLVKEARPLYPMSKVINADVEVLVHAREPVPHHLLHARLEAFPVLGKKLYAYLLRSGVLTRAVGLSRQNDETTMLGKQSAMLAVAYSLMFCEVPVQVRGNIRLCEALCELVYDTRAMDEDHVDLGREKQLKLFPPKRNPAVTNRTNVYFSEVYECMRRLRPHLARDFDRYGLQMMGLSNDQAAGCLLYGAALYGAGVKNPCKIAIRAVTKPALASELSTALKSLGLQGSVKGAVLVEADSLQGRGTGAIDLKAVMRPRTRRGDHENTLFADQDALRIAIETIYDEEIDMGRYEYQTPEDFWSSRWEWGVNGSHSRILQAHEPRWKVEPPELKRLHRRVYLEEVEGLPLDNWSGTVYVSCIKKVENAKERDLQAIDSNSYIAFEHLIKGVERSWKGRRVVLDPGRGGAVGIARRIRQLQAKRSGRYNVMIDYAKYNSQQSLASQMNVVGILCEKIGYPAGMSRRLVESFRKMELFVDGERLGLAQWSLMSGHRLTTFINSVLNLAYLKVYCPVIDSCPSVHVGDDVYVMTSGLPDAALLMEQLLVSPILAKPEKQSMGDKSAEFLRMCITDRRVMGYVCRSISTTIMANWVSDLRLNAPDALQSMVTNAWTLGNRCCDPDIGTLLKSSVCRMTGLDGDVASALLSGRAALNDGPARARGTLIRRYEVTFLGGKAKSEMRSYKAKATRAYCENHITPIEMEALRLSQASVFGAMCEASYVKSLMDVSNGNEDSKFGHDVVERVAGVYSSARLEEVQETKPEPGLLERYPIIQLIKNQLSKSVLRLIMRDVSEGRTDLMSDEDLYVTAWGRREKGCAIHGYLGYSDAASLSALTKAGMIMCDIDMCV